MAKKILASSDLAQQYYREIGKRLDRKKPPRFYLGDDEKQATVNNSRLEALWAGVKERWQNFVDSGLTMPPYFEEAPAKLPIQVKAAG